MSKFSAKERMLYHANLSKKGSVNKNGEPISDFQRGVHLAKSKEICRQRGKAARIYKKQRKNSTNDNK